MKSKKVHFTVSVCENGKRWAYALSVDRSNNIVSVLGRIRGLETATVTATDKEAKEYAYLMNDSFKANGTAMY